MIVIEHDLAILDVICDLIHVVYGERAAYGIFTPPRQTRTAINAYLDGYLEQENIRIRDKPIRFLRGRMRGEEIGEPILEWGDLEKHKAHSISKPSTAKCTVRKWSAWSAPMRLEKQPWSR